MIAKIAAKTIAAVAFAVASLPVAMPVAGAQGYVLDDPAQLAALPHVTRYRAFLPARKDLSADLPPPGDQGDQGSCVAWSLGYAVRSYYEHRREQRPFSGPQSVFSPAYIYNQLTRTPRTCQGGLSLLQALRFVEKNGIATLADFPYDDRNCSARPSQSLMQRASHYAITGFTLLDLRADDVKGQLANGNPVAVGLAVEPHSLSALRAGQIYSVNSRSSKEGHAVAFVGYDDTRQAFKFLNSWGPRWADHGYGWISYDAFEQDAQVAAVIADGGPAPPAPRPTPTPTPTPGPGPVVADWRNAMVALARNFQCSSLTIARDGNRTLIVGWVGQQADLDALRSLVARIDPSEQVSLVAALRPWPQCEALLTLDDVVTDHGLHLTADGNDDHDYAAGSRIVLHVVTPDFPSYLYVTYIEASGEAVPLYTPRGVVPQALPPKTTLTLGGGSDPRVFKVGAPFGHEMVIAVASASPLFTDGIPPSATEREYLSALRKTLEYKPDPNQPNRLVDGDAIAITTHDASPAPQK